MSNSINQLSVLLELQALRGMSGAAFPDGGGTGSLFETLLSEALLQQQGQQTAINRLPLGANSLGAVSRLTSFGSFSSSPSSAAAAYGSHASTVSAPASIEGLIQKAAASLKLPAALIHSVIKHESGYNPKAVSHAGASGLMQLMPQTARGLGVTDIFDPEQNIMAGSKFLKQMLDRYHGNVELALAAYNAGPGNVDKYGGIPPFKETQSYVKKVTGTYYA